PILREFICDSVGAFFRIGLIICHAKRVVILVIMCNGEMALRFSIDLSVIGFVAVTAARYETDRRKKNSSTTREQDLIELNQRIQTLGSQVRVLSAQLDTSEHQIRALVSQVDQYDARLIPGRHFGGG
ncbi:MAG: hypothetical protein WCD54_12620, partial [Pseudolabrys sp.]